jgi:hypothetical protein
LALAVNCLIFPKREIGSVFEVGWNYEEERKRESQDSVDREP